MSRFDDYARPRRRTASLPQAHPAGRGRPVLQAHRVGPMRAPTTLGSLPGVGRGAGRLRDAGRGNARTSRAWLWILPALLISAYALGATNLIAPTKSASDPRPSATAALSRSAAAIAESPDPGQLGVPPVASPERHGPLPPCVYANELATDAGYGDWARTLIDTTFRLAHDYSPPDLVPVSRAGLLGAGSVRQFVIPDLKAMASAAQKAGSSLAAASAFRSFTRQAEVFAEWERSSDHEEALRYSARPGHSEHQLGTAIDLQVVGGTPPWQGSFASTAAARWVAAHAWEYGFVLSFPTGREAVTCYGAEPWHIRYMGKTEARAVHASGLTLREWLWEHAAG